MDSQNKSIIKVADGISAQVVVFPGVLGPSEANNTAGSSTTYVFTQSAWEGGEQLVASAQSNQQLSSAFLLGSDVPTLIPYLYKIAKSRDAHLVLYVIGSLYNVYTLQECGFVIIIANTPEEFQDLSLAGSILSHQLGAPVCVWVPSVLDPRYEFRICSESILPMFSIEQSNSRRSGNEQNLNEAALTLFNALVCGESSDDKGVQNKYSCLEYIGDSTAELIVVAYPTITRSILDHIARNNTNSIGIVVVRVLRPWSPSVFLSILPKSVKKIQVMDLAPPSFMASPPQLFLDIASAFQSVPDAWEITPELVSMVYQQDSPSAEVLAEHIVANVQSQGPIVEMPLLTPSNDDNSNTSLIRSTSLDSHVALPYTQMLKTAFGERLRLEDASHSHSIESILGEYVAYIREREVFADLLATTSNSYGSSELREALRAWHRSRTQAALSEKYGNIAIKLITSELPSTPQLQAIYERRQLFFKLALWILGAENWANDLQYSGIHHCVSFTCCALTKSHYLDAYISSGVSVNLLLLDTQIYPSKTVNAKKDVGLYAMNYGNTYVASVAIYTNYTHVLHSLLEAENFDGPSVVLAYLPLSLSSKLSTEPLTTASDAIMVMKNSKVAVDMGVWPLYRWNPDSQKQNGKGFTLESERIKEDLKAFLAKENELSLIINSAPTLPLSVPNVLDLRLNALEESFTKLSSGIAPLLILFGSDTGHAESLAKKMEAKGKRNKRNARALPMDELQPVDLQTEPTVLFIIATAGQGEFPANSKEFWKRIHKLSSNDLNLDKMNYSVFALGDSHYWPAPSGEIYFCKPGKELDNKLEDLGGKKIIPVGLGDDQDADGYLTGFAKWETEVWEYLGVAGDVGTTATITDDQNKINSNFLRGTIAQGLADLSTGALAELDTKITKFHGIYQQDDRDLRDARKAQGLEKAFSFMVRLRIPGGIITPAQYLALDTISDHYASSTIRLTTRQTIQYHGIIKRNLRTAMQAINKTLLDTIAACGDVNRNVLCTSNPALAPSEDIHNELVELATNWSLHMLPKTGAYREIWLDDKLVKGGDTVQDFEPIYGPTYLPRKFKAVVAIPPYNDVDIFAHDLGYIAIVENGQIVGYNVTVGGGMGMTHGNKKTFPRIADVMGFVEKHQAIDVGEKVVLVQRDFGDRTNRKHARLKYTIEDRGIDWFRSEVEARLGYKLQPARPFHFTDNADRYGWVKGNNNKWHYTMFIQNGRVKDTPEYPLRTGLRELAKIHKGDLRFTANQNLIISNVNESDKSNIDELMEKYKIANKRNSAIRLNSMACVALPTCGLAFSESERYLPSLVSLIDEELTKLGLWEEPITIRMTGCPNGCARPYVAEIGLVGKAPGIYNLYIGGGFAGQRLNKLFKEAANEKEILAALLPLLQRYANEKHPGEPFGDFVIRAGAVKQVTGGGIDFHD